MRPPTASGIDTFQLYLDEIGRFDLLTKEDEARLGQLVQQGMQALHILESGEKLPARRRRELRQQIVQGAEAESEFITANLRLVVSIAKRYGNEQKVGVADLVQEGNLGLIHAVRKFDWEKGFKFSTYATWWIRQAISRGISNMSRNIRLPYQADEYVRSLVKARDELAARGTSNPSIEELAKQTGLDEELVIVLLGRWDVETVSLDSATSSDDEGSSLGDFVPDSEDSINSHLTSIELRRQVTAALPHLPEQYAEILVLRHGLDGSDPRTLSDVGKVVGLTRERVRQIENRAMSMLRHPALGVDWDALGS